MELTNKNWIITLLTTLIVISHRVASQDICQHTWLTYSGWNILNGTLDNTAKTVLQCRTSCLQFSDSIGFDFDGAGSCWINFFGDLKKETAPKSTVTHYTLLRTVNSCTATCMNGNSTSWSAKADINVPGSTPTSDTTVLGCVTSCTNNPLCVGFDWDTKSPNCWLTTNSNEAQKSATGITHFERQCTTSGTRIVTPGFIASGQSKSGVFSTIQVKPSTQGFNRASSTLGLSSKIPTNGYQTSTLKPVVPGSDTTRSAADSEKFVYIRGQAIKPAYIVLAGLGAGCLLLVIIAVVVLCVYPLRGDSGGGYKEKKHQVKKVKKVKKQKDVGELHTRRPKTLSEEEHIGMSTVTTTVNRNSYDGNSYNNKHKSNGSTIDYDRTNDYNHKDSANDYNHKDSGHEYNRRDSGDSIRKSGGYEDTGDADSIADKAHDRVNSMADDAKDEYNEMRHSANDNASYIRDEYD